MNKNKWFPEIGEIFYPFITMSKKPAIGGVCTCLDVEWYKDYHRKIHGVDAFGNERIFPVDDFYFEKEKRKEVTMPPT